MRRTNDGEIQQASKRFKKVQTELLQKTGDIDSSLDFLPKLQFIFTWTHLINLEESNVTMEQCC